MKKILLRDVKKAEADYADSLMIWGEYNQITIRAMIKYKDLKDIYEEERNNECD